MSDWNVHGESCLQMVSPTHLHTKRDGEGEGGCRRQAER